MTFWFSNEALKFVFPVCIFRSCFTFFLYAWIKVSSEGHAGIWEIFVSAGIIHQNFLIALLPSLAASYKTQGNSNPNSYVAVFFVTQM